jgi:hypothetical protein
MLLEILTIVFHYKNDLNAFLTMLIDWIDYTLLIVYRMFEISCVHDFCDANFWLVFFHFWNVSYLHM